MFLYHVTPMGFLFTRRFAVLSHMLHSSFKAGVVKNAKQFAFFTYPSNPIR